MVYMFVEYIKIMSEKCFLILIIFKVMMMKQIIVVLGIFSFAES